MRTGLETREPAETGHGDYSVIRENGVLYVVATPIGNLGDLSQRAINVLREVAVIAAEDTRYTARLLHAHGIDTPCVAVHEHNEREKVPQRIERLLQGESLALVSDAGTPLVSDPGYHLVRAAIKAGIRVVPVPGPSALIAALSASGLPTDRFCLEGFLPARATARRKRLEGLRTATVTLVFYESPHRILDTLDDLLAVFGPDRPLVLARELTKTFETFLRGTVAEVREQVCADPDQRRGEMVLLLKGAETPGREDTLLDEERLLATLLEELPVSQAAALAARITGGKKNRLYQRALELQQEK